MHDSKKYIHSKSFNNIMTFPKESFVKTILDLYSEKTGVPVAFVRDNKVIWQTSKTFCSPYCQELNKLYPKKCHDDHIKRSKIDTEKLTLCHAGLWNFAMPIKKDGKNVGALLTGQRRLHGNEQESLERLTGFQNELSESQYSELKQRFYDTPIIKEFDIDLMKTLEPIEERLFDVFISWDIQNRKILNIAHAFLLPIQSIIANAENISTELSEDRGELKEQAEDLMHQVIKLGMTAENMRSSIMGTDKEVYHYELGDILDLLKENITIFKNEALRKSVGFKGPILIAGSSTILPMSYYHLNRAFFNLIHNAVKYSYFSMSSQNRYINIEVRSTHKWLTVEISNYGIGILDEEIKEGRIFEDGYRGKLSSDKERTGSGIGLPEAKRVIEKHGGRINIVSRLLGANEFSGPYLTTVHVELPRFRD